MTIKEKPLIDAASDADALPNFLFANSITAGVFASLMCSFFGGMLIFFNAVGRGGVDTLEVFEAVRVGAIGGLIFAAVVFIGTAISTVRAPDERATRLQFALGGFLGIAALVVADYFFLDEVRAVLENAPPMVGSPRW